jgi:hypothetical protein
MRRSPDALLDGSAAPPPPAPAADRLRLDADGLRSVAADAAARVAEARRRLDWLEDQRERLAARRQAFSLDGACDGAGVTDGRVSQPVGSDR